MALTVTDDHVRLGELKGVTAAAITLREKTGISLVSRAQIGRVAVREPAGLSRWPRVVQGAAIGAAIAAVPAYAALAHYENGNHAGPLQFVLLGTGIGAAVGAMRAPQQVFRERLIYVKP